LRTSTTLRNRIATNTYAVKDKAQHAVVLDKQTNDKLQKDVQSYRLITVATLVDRLKINGSLARQALADLEANGQIKKVVGHSKLSIYSMSQQQQLQSSISPKPWNCWISIRTFTNILQHELSAPPSKPYATDNQTNVNASLGYFFQLFNGIPLSITNRRLHEMNGSYYIGMHAS
jgi:small subunit ribosomal protein S25e